MAQMQIKAFGFKPINKNQDMQSRQIELISEIGYSTINYIGDNAKELNRIPFTDLYLNLENNSKKISLNSKNIEYSELLGLDFCKGYFKGQCENINEQISIIDEDGNSVSMTEEEFNDYINLHKYIEKYDPENKNPNLAIWQGEHPFLTYHIIRLGNENFEFLTFNR